MNMFTVPIVATDLRHEETIIQSVQALEHLQFTIMKLFDKIDNRIEKNNIKIKDIKNRINVVERKINSLFNVRKAIRIFSSAKFPAAHVFGNIPCTLNGADLRANQEVQSDDYQITSSPDPIHYKNVQDKLMFYHVRTYKLQDQLPVGERNQDWEADSSNITFVNSLFLYDNSHNIYEKRKTAEITKKEPSQIRNKSETNAFEQKIGAAPHSMSHRKIYDKKTNEGYSYTPKLTDAPEINVPIDLPDLPGIADDIVFQLMEEEKIAPSLYIENLPDLPEPLLTDAEEKDMKQSESAGNKTRILEVIPPPPPPPPPISSPTNIVSESKLWPLTAESGPKSEKFDGELPPPSIPIPPPLPKATTFDVRNLGGPDEVIRKGTLTKTTPSMDAADVRSNLMEAIREFGTRGGRLRAATNVAKHESNVNDLKTPGDFMADLHMKLSMRRKGISGTNQAEANQSTGSVVDRLSALIPPPPVNQQISAIEASDEDWD